MKAWEKQKGFTIVELLIVIVVIAILAAITIVAFNGIQERARYSAMQQDLKTLNNAINMYYTDNNQYPSSGSTGGNVIGASPNIPGLVPTYINSIPTIPNDGKGGYYAYIYSANGADYKLVRLASSPANLPTVERSAANGDPSRTGRGWGYWSAGGSGL